ncbi:MAG TPA: hypothetical protein VFS81_06235, partial [Candidatus Binatia bacterium]|nr:hypothetical protein [Candidatus Binatia bacterium]
RFPITAEASSDLIGLPVSPCRAAEGLSIDEPPPLTARRRDVSRLFAGPSYKKHEGADGSEIRVRLTY